MAQNNIAAVSIAPNFHEFQPSILEAELAKLAAPNSGTAANLLQAAGAQRQQDFGQYQDMVQGAESKRADALMQQERMQQFGDTLRALVNKGIDPAIALHSLGIQQTPSGQAMVNSGIAKDYGEGIKGAGQGVEGAANAGQPFAIDPLHQSLLGIAQGSGVPISVQKENASGSGKTKVTYTGTDPTHPDVPKFSVTGPDPSNVFNIGQTMEKWAGFPKEGTQAPGLNGVSMPPTRGSGAAGTVAPGTNVGQGAIPQSSLTTQSSAPPDASAQPMIAGDKDIFGQVAQQVLSPGESITGSQTNSDGSVSFQVGRNKMPTHVVRVYKDGNGAPKVAVQ